MKLLGIDYGTKWVGVAYSEGVYSRGLTQFSTREALSLLKRLIAQLEITNIIIGTAQGRVAEKVREFGERLQDETSIPVTFWDETLTSIHAGSQLFQTNASRKRRQLHIHKQAAANILESYIEGNKKL